MKKVLTTITSVALLATPLLVFAQRSAPTIDVMNALDVLTDWLFTILLVIAAIFIIIAAYMFVTAQGDPEKVKTARNFVLYAVIGVMVAVLAKGLVLLGGMLVGY